MNRWIRVMLAICISITLLEGYRTPNTIEAATDSAFENSISAFPDSYKVYLRKLHETYPKWKFVAYNTGIKFNTAVKNEFSNNRSLIENSFCRLLKSNENSSDYNASTGTYIAKDGGSWVSSSRNCVAYFMDPRNFLDKEHIYMFEQLSYDSATQTKAGVEAILQGSFMYKTKIGYITTAGKYKSTDIYYSDQILEAAKESKVSAYYIASKIIQEIGRKANATYAGMGASGSVSGKYSSTYTGIYNFYNIGATSGNYPIANGLSWASAKSGYSRPWNTPMKSINGGAQYIGEKYINCGQNTPYYQRFNVNKQSTYSLYTHQYMTNIYGAASEAANTADAYESLGIAPLEKTFVIPVFKSMPKDNNTITYGNASKKGSVSSAVNVRKSANTSSNIVTTLSAGDSVTITKAVLTSCEFGSKWLSNPYWYKISVKKNGKTYKGYVAATYVKITQEYSLMKGKSMTVPKTLGEEETVYYRSDDPAIATVNTSGKITGKKAGTVTVYAFTAAGNFSATSIRVFTKGCTFDETWLTLNVGTKKQLTATVYPTTATNKTVTYTSSNKSIATVTSAGKIKAKAPGTVTITGTSEVGGMTASCTVKVVQPVTKISLNKSSVSLTVDSSKKLVASLQPQNASDKTIKWETSNSSIAKVNSDGTIVAKAAGEVTITASSHNGLKATCSIKVTPKKVVMTGKSAGYNAVKLSWDKTSNLTGYYVYRKNTSGKDILITTLSGNAKSYVDKELKTGQSYSYRIKAFRKIGNKTYKGKKSATVSVMPIPKKTKIKSVTSINGGATIMWSKIEGATGYEIHRKNVAGVYKKIKTVKGKETVSWSNTGLKSGETYYYRVRAYTKSSGKKVFGNFSKQAKIKK